MSRGHGDVQRFVLSHLPIARDPTVDGVDVDYLAWARHHTMTPTAAQLNSIRRALASLHTEGLIDRRKRRARGRLRWVWFRVEAATPAPDQEDRHP